MDLNIMIFPELFSDIPVGLCGKISEWEIHNTAIWFLSSCLRAGARCPHPTVSWAAQCVLTLAHLPVRPKSNANHTGWQCSANPAISKLLSHSFTPPHRLHCGRKHTGTRSPREHAVTDCNSNVSLQGCQNSALHDSEQFLYEHRREATTMNQRPRIHRRFIK